MKEQKRVPKLRFAEFVDDYLKLEFSEIASRSKKTYNPNKDLTNYKCVELESLTQVTGELIKTFDSIELKSNKTKFEVNDVLYGKLRPYLKKYWLATFEGVCTSEIWVLKGKAVKNTYLFQLIQTDKFNYEANLTTGSKMPRADWEYISSIKYAIPTLPEQLKIASFLSAFDKKIAQLQQKKRLLEDYKKGVMQQIFSQELRFTKEDGSAYPDWEEKRLGNISLIRTGKLDANAMVENGKYRFYTCAKGYYLINDYAFDTEALLISGNGANVGYIHYYNGKFNAYQRTYVLDEFEENIIYIKYYLEKFLSERIEREKKDGNTPYIVLSTLREMTIELPTTEEQTQIAHFLSAIDNKIAVVQTQIEKTQTFKKGLLQQMFV